jgi:hypothetical protein
MPDMMVSTNIQRATSPSRVGAGKAGQAESAIRLVLR